MDVQTMRREMQDVLTKNILPFWITKMADHYNGGFYGRVDGQGLLHLKAERGAILNARILWTFSAAYRVLGNQRYLDSAQRAKDYFIRHFIDHDYGGVYWIVDHKGKPLNTRKQFYAIAFAVYALTEYARATGDREALDYALQLFDCIEEHALDPVDNGYIEATTRDWQPIADMRLSELDANAPKSQNTHLHILEAYTNLLRCLKEMQAAESCDYVPVLGSILPITISVPVETLARVEGALRNIVRLFTSKIINAHTHHLDLFFSMDWERSAAHIESYGHDIECSWLLYEAIHVLADSKMQQAVEPLVQAMALAAKKGLAADGSMIHEANLDTGDVDHSRLWWVQAETVVGYVNIYQQFGDSDAWQTACRCWEYIKNNLIDYDSGEWYWSRDANGNINRTDDKAGFWKCPYHNSRMCIEIIERNF